MSMVIESMRDNDLLLSQIDPLDFARKKLHLAKHLAHGIDDGRQIQVAGRDLMKHRREEAEIIAIDKLDLDAIASQSFLKLHGGCDPDKASAENEDAFGRTIFHRSSPGASLAKLRRAILTVALWDGGRKGKDTKRRGMGDLYLLACKEAKALNFA
jgi:hypothetical protein